jgi:hypothetical protein
VRAISRVPVDGKSTIGNSEVTGMGTASVIHQSAIQAADARAARDAGVMPSGSGIS